MAQKLSDAQKELLKRYGRLYRIHHSKLNKISVEQEYESVKREMDRQSLNHQDYEEFERMEKYLQAANDLIRVGEEKEAANNYGMVKIILGAILLFVGIGLSADTPFFFYGAILSGIGLMINGGMDIYYAKE